MAIQAETRRFKVVEFYKLGEVGILSEDDPVELLDGQIMIMAPIPGYTDSPRRVALGGGAPVHRSPFTPIRPHALMGSGFGE
jgi:hypothetical protein